VSQRPPIRHCRECGAAVVYRLPDDGDTKLRAVCPVCHTVHYENPLNVVGTVPWLDDRVLLCKRNIEPRRGYWTLPAGFMELAETTAQGAARETDEEAGALIEMQELFTVINVVKVGQVHFYYRARLLSDQFDPGHETMETRLYTEAEIPWNEIAFHTVRDTLKLYFEDRRKGRFELHHFDIS
jgi:ADP-ribose pyrophosphatase YjhB (NUDIX family)